MESPMMNAYTRLSLAAIPLVIFACSHPTSMMSGGGEGGIMFHEDTGGGGAAPCGGCITPTLACEPGDTEVACGRGGHSCEACAFTNASGSCSDGACVLGACDYLFLNCDGNDANGCETPKTNADNCGACGVRCAAGQMCLEHCDPSKPNDPCTFTCE
jgi:hypothetical protein